MESTSRRPLPRPRVALVLFVLFAPFAVLTVLAVRTLEQDRELAVRRAEDDRRQMVAAVRQELLGRLENLELRVLSRLAGTGASAPTDVPDEVVVLVARVQDDRLVLPWEHRGAAEVRRVLAEQPFAGIIARGEAEEVVRRRPGSAASEYARALDASRHLVQTATAELLVARALGKAGRSDEAFVYTRRLLAHPLSLADDQGVPFALYAARRAAELAGLQAAEALAVLDVAGQASVTPGLPPLAAHMAAFVAAALHSNGPPEVREAASHVGLAAAARIAYYDQALALQQTFPALARQFPSPGAPGRDPYWLPFGDDPWLLSLTTDAGTGQPILVAIDAAQVFERLETVASCAAAGGCRLALASDAGPDDDAFGPSLPGLALVQATTLAAVEPRGWISGQGFYAAALSLVLALAAFGAYLLWRDVRRELHVAALRSQFVSSVSHELKTPLTAIRMFAETLRMGRLADPALRNEYLDTIVNESERLTRLLNNVLDFSRIEGGRKTYQFSAHDMAVIVRTAVRTMHYPFARQGFELRVEIEEGLPPVLGDADALEQAILNLLANALKYSGDARRIELRLARGGPWVVIGVRDWGVGIAPVDQRRIFDKFFRVERPENRLIPGTGLGLTLVEHIVRSHGGRVEVDSVPGGGSTFRIHLPLAPDESTASEEISAETASRRTAGSES